MASSTKDTKSAQTQASLPSSLTPVPGVPLGANNNNNNNNDRTVATNNTESPQTLGVFVPPSTSASGALQSTSGTVGNGHGSTIEIDVCTWTL